MEELHEQAGLETFASGRLGHGTWSLNELENIRKDVECAFVLEVGAGDEAQRFRVKSKQKMPQGVPWAGGQPLQYLSAVQRALSQADRYLGLNWALPC